jgi:hypothetical protein
MVNRNTETTLQRPVGTFNTQNEAETARQRLETAGFNQDQISIVLQDADPNPSMQNSQVGRSAIGGAIAGSALGAIVATLLKLTTQYLPDVGETAPTASSGVAVICVIVGIAAGSLIAALAGNNAPHAQSGTDRESLTQCYIVMLDGTKEEAVRATETLGQPEIRV